MIVCDSEAGGGIEYSVQPMCCLKPPESNL
jgi:hypothetical protein